MFDITKEDRLILKMDLPKAYVNTITVLISDTWKFDKTALKKKIIKKAVSRQKLC